MHSFNSHTKNITYKVPDEPHHDYQRKGEKDHVDQFYPVKSGMFDRLWAPYGALATVWAIRVLSEWLIHGFLGL